MSGRKNSQCVEPCVELPSEILLLGIEKCGDMLQFIATMNRTINELLKNLNQAVEDAEILRRNVLISKTTGVVAASIGTTLNVIGLILIPFTAGISVPILCGTGTFLAVGGTVTNVGTTIAEIPIKASQSENITNLLCTFKKSQDLYDQNTEKLEQALRKCDSIEFEYIGKFFKHERQLDVTKWLRAGYLHKDEDISDMTDLRKGDHILRTIRSSPCHQHHGIYIDDDMVVELIKDRGVQFRSLKDFTQKELLKRRMYGGYDIPAVETFNLAKEALVNNLHSYSLLTNNCEHFATSMKLKIPWSGQVDSAFTITTEVFKNIHRPISLTIEGVETGAQITAALAPKSILSFSTPVMSGLSKAAIVLAPISVALDITSLVFEYLKENTSAEVCNKTLEKLKEIQLILQKRKKQFEAQKKLLTERRRKAELFEREVRQLEAQRMEEGQEELRRLEAKRMEEERIEQIWRDGMGIKLVSFCILYFCKFMGLINI